MRDGARFDAMTRAMATSRRTLVRRLVGGAGGAALGWLGLSMATHAQGNRECVALCKSLFESGEERGQCISAGARGEGPCAEPAGCTTDACVPGEPTITCGTHPSGFGCFCASVGGASVCGTIACQECVVGEPCLDPLLGEGTCTTCVGTCDVIGTATACIGPCSI